MSAPTLTFLGAAGTVTGSKFLLTSNGHRVLVDCGLFQGDREWRRRNWEPLPVDPAAIDAVVVTHAHLDHSGYLPVLARDGFGGPIVCSADTARLLAIVLRDAAHIQEEEARWAGQSGLSRHDPPLPLYVSADAEKALRQVEPLAQRQSRLLAGDLSVMLHRAGHILGSRFAAITVGAVRIVFSGDLGRPDHPLLLPPEAPGDADYFVVESTYGDRRHPTAPTDDLAAALTRTLERGGVALLPAFAVDRTAMLLHEIRGLVVAGRVPNVPVFVDSPMALAALDVYRNALHRGDDEFRPEVTGAADPFNPGRLELVPDIAGSQQLNDPKSPCIIISASGMASGGRVLHHLERQLRRSRNSVILTGFQVAGTRGHALAGGAAQLKIHGHYIPVRAEIADIGGFSAHADSQQMVSWLRGSVEPRTVFVVHGEPAAAAGFAATLRDELDWTAVVPRHQERVLVD